MNVIIFICRFCGAELGKAKFDAVLKNFMRITGSQSTVQHGDFEIMMAMAIDINLT